MWYFHNFFSCILTSCLYLSYSFSHHIILLPFFLLSLVLLMGHCIVPNSSSQSCLFHLSSSHIMPSSSFSPIFALSLSFSCIHPSSLPIMASSCTYLNPPPPPPLLCLSASHWFSLPGHDIIIPSSSISCHSPTGVLSSPPSALCMLLTNSLPHSQGMYTCPDPIRWGQTRSYKVVL